MFNTIPHNKLSKSFFAQPVNEVICHSFQKISNEEWYNCFIGIFHGFSPDFFDECEF
jgi:hypothetical protein